jgi:hypothetical protein
LHAGVGWLRIEEAPGVQGGIAHELSAGDVPWTLSAPHEAGYFVNFYEPIHAAPQPELVAMLFRTKVAVAAYA